MPPSSLPTPYPNAVVEGKHIVIRISIDELCSEHYVPDNLLDENEEPRFNILNKNGFAQHVCDEINAENPDDGTNMVHEMLDKAYEAAVENGSEHADEILNDEDDDEDDELEDEDE